MHPGSGARSGRRAAGPSRDGAGARWRPSTDLRPQLATQGLDGAEREPSHGPGATAHGLRRLLGREACRVAQGERLLLVGGELADRAAKLANLLAAERDLLEPDLVAWFGGRIERLERPGAPHVIDDGIPCDPEGPRGERSPIVAVARNCGDDALEDLVGDVLGVLAAADPDRDVAIYRTHELV